MSIDTEPTATAQTPSLSERVGLEIKVEMLRAGISGRRLALRMGVSQTWISTRVTGATPIDVNELERIANALGLSASDLLLKAAAAAPSPSRFVKEPYRRLKSSRHTTTREATPASPVRQPRVDSRRPVSAIPATRRRPQAVLRPGNRPKAA